MLEFLDSLLFSAHIIIIAFNLFGWIHPKTRKAHLIVVGLTLFSWIILGFWKGFGYCILTDWEWDIKRELGEKNLPPSFIAYITNNIFNLDLSRGLVDAATVGFFVLAILMATRNYFSKKAINSVQK